MSKKPESDDLSKYVNLTSPEEYVSCYECGHAIKKKEAICIPVKDRYDATPRYFSVGCKPDYVRVSTTLWDGETRFYETAVTGTMRNGVFKSWEDIAKEEVDETE